MDALREDESVSHALRAPGSSLLLGWVGYRAPPESAVLRGVESGAEPGLEYDGDSEDELDVMAQVGGVGEV